MRLDNLSHILVWTLDPRADGAEAAQIKRNREAAAARKTTEAAAAAAANNPSNTANSSSSNSGGGGGSKEPGGGGVAAAAAAAAASADAGGRAGLPEQHDDDEGYDDEPIRSSAEKKGSVEVDVVELPRLKLTFRTLAEKVSMDSAEEPTKEQLRLCVRDRPSIRPPTFSVRATPSVTVRPSNLPVPLRCSAM